MCIRAHERFAPRYTLNCCRKVPLEFLFRGYYHLIVGIPPEPYAIKWENSRPFVLGKILVFILFLAIVAILFATTLGLTYTLS